MIGVQVTETDPVYEQSLRTGIIICTTESELGVKGYLVEAIEETPLSWLKKNDNLYKKYHENLNDESLYFWISKDNSDLKQESVTVMGDQLKNFFG